MTRDEKEIEDIFKIFVEGTLVEHNIQKSLSVISDDVMGIGMGNQGVVSGKEDLIRILGDGKSDTEGTVTTVSYENMQIRCYEGRFGTICGILKIQTVEKGQTLNSSLGQMMGVRKERGRWFVFAVQATPLFNEIEEMEAFPIKFAENALEKYRQQEQIAKSAQKNSVAIYRINFTRSIFEDSILRNDMVIPVEAGDPYENTIFQSAWKYLSEEDRYLFVSKFSLGNIIRAYNSGKTELSMEYKRLMPGSKAVWLRTVIRLYMDKKEGCLKGYLYVFDIDKEKRREIELQNRVERDPMTDLYNKKYSEIKIGERLKCITPDNRGVFFMLDLDHFKGINDTYGHGVGDMVIRETADYMKRLVRREDIAGRLGGDEFCIYFQGKLTPETAMEKAERLCKRIRSIIPSREKGTSCSIGIVYCDSPCLSFEEVYKKADEALYKQKESGRDGYTVLRIQAG